MTLRRKLLTIFLGLGFLALTIVGLTFWTLTQWRGTNALLRDHYQRSLLVQRISTATFRALKELPDAAFAGDADAESEFKTLLEPVEADFAEWVALAYNAREREQVRRVRAAYNALVADAETFFVRIAAADRRGALELLEGRLETTGFVAFSAATGDAIASDRDNRERIRDRTERIRRNAWVVLSVAAFATLSLILLLAAYLSSDLFKPLKQLGAALGRAAKGDFGTRLDAERHDEFGAVNRAFNTLSAATEKRERGSRPDAPSASEAPSADEAEGGDAQTSRRMLHQLVGRLRGQVADLGAGAENPAQQALLVQIDRLSHTVMRMTAFGFPVDLTLAETDLRALLYEVVVRFHERLAERSVSFELRVAPELGDVVLDRLKVREVLGELLENALDALPERGGQLGLRASSADDGEGFLLEVADNGRGVDAARLERSLLLDRDDDVGLKLSKAVVEAHGGSFVIESEPSQGTYVQLRFPFYQN